MSEDDPRRDPEFARRWADPLCNTCYGYGVVLAPGGDDTEPCPSNCHDAIRVHRLRAGYAYPTHPTEQEPPR